MIWASSLYRPATLVSSPVPMFTSLPEPRSIAWTNACTTSSMNTKSRVWFPSP